jgi:hypothetical protein
MLHPSGIGRGKWLSPTGSVRERDNPPRSALRPSHPKPFHLPFWRAGISAERWRSRRRHNPRCRSQAARYAGQAARATVFRSGVRSGRLPGFQGVTARLLVARPRARSARFLLRSARAKGNLMAVGVKGQEWRHPTAPKAARTQAFRMDTQLKDGSWWSHTKRAVKRPQGPGEQPLWLRLGRGRAHSHAGKKPDQATGRQRGRLNN